jgi:hypothetical protein
MSGPDSRESSQVSHTKAACFISPAQTCANCPVCDWENLLVSDTVAIPLPLVPLTSVYDTHLSSQPLFFVRQTVALRESRGPPRTA